MKHEVVDDPFPIRTNSAYSLDVFSNPNTWIPPFIIVEEGGMRVSKINPEWDCAKYDIRYVIARDA